MTSKKTLARPALSDPHAKNCSYAPNPACHASCLRASGSLAEAVRHDIGVAGINGHLADDLLLRVAWSFGGVLHDTRRSRCGHEKVTLGCECVLMKGG